MLLDVPRLHFRLKGELIRIEADAEGREVIRQTIAAPSIQTFEHQIASISTSSYTFTFVPGWAATDRKVELGVGFMETDGTGKVVRQARRDVRVASGETARLILEDSRREGSPRGYDFGKSSPGPYTALYLDVTPSDVGVPLGGFGLLP
jgi:hypothetical protein